MDSEAGVLNLDDPKGRPSTVYRTMLNYVKFRSAISLTLVLLLVLTGMPVSAAELTAAAPVLGEVTGIGEMEVSGQFVNSANLIGGEHIRTGDLSSAKLVLSNGSRIELASKSEVVLSSTEQEIRLQMSAGSMAFAASNSRIAIAIDRYQFLPEAGSSGSIAIIQAGTAGAPTAVNRAVLQVLTGNVTFHDSEQNTDVVIAGGSERIVELAPGTQIASNIPTPIAGALSQDPAQVPPAQRPPNLPTTDPAQTPPAQRPGNLPTTDTGTQPTVPPPASGSKTVPIVLGVGGGVAAAILIAALASSDSSDDETPPPCGTVSCPLPPSISTLTPTQGNVGSLVTISGSNFGATQGTSTVTFNGIAATAITSWTATSIVAAVPAGAATGNVVVTTSGGASNILAFTVNPSPAITTLTPNNGPAGTSVTIAGANFGAAQGNSTVTFNGTAAAVTSWSATSIVTVVPGGATSGPVVVTTAAGGPSNNDRIFAVGSATTITSLTPNNGPVGSSVTIAGVNFGATQGSSTVRFNGTLATTISSWTASSIVAVVPAGATTGNVVVTTAEGGASNGIAFTVNPSTTVTSLTPNAGTVGSTVTISGANFGAAQGNSTVTFNGTPATSINSWSAASIVALVPAGASSGPVVVTTTAGGPSNGVVFTVNPSTTITSLTPGSGPVGSMVTIAGTSFGDTQGSSTITFNGTPATNIISWTAASIVAEVPAGATTGNVVVTTTAGGPSNGFVFTVNASTTITSLTPNSGPVGSSVTIAGANFGATQGDGIVTFNGTLATTISSWTATSIDAVVPGGATTGNVVVTTTAGGSSNGSLFTVIAYPVITSLQPDNGVVGSLVRIAGANFGAEQANSTVDFGAITATDIAYWSDEVLIVTVPAGAMTGNVVVTTGAGASNGMLFTIAAPVITSVAPDNGVAGDFVRIFGTNFGATQGTGTVTLGETAADVIYWSDEVIIFPVPANATTGNVVVNTDARGPSNGVLFTVNGSELLVGMSVDQSVVSPGDSVAFSLNVTNPANVPLTVASLNNTLPPGFTYMVGSAIIRIIGANGEELPGQAIVPIVNASGLVFPIGALDAGGRISIRYSALVLSDAHPGEQRSGVAGIASLLSGKRVNSNSAQVRVVVAPSVFTLNQVLIGRVFDDRNGNGSYDTSEPGVANVRVVTSSGQTATTDSDGLYNLPSLAAGSVLAAVDPSTLPPGFELPRNESRLGGAGRLLRTPLEGGGLLRQNFALIRTAASIPAGTTMSSLTGREGARNGGESSGLEFIIERPIMAAGAYDKQLIRVQARDDQGRATDMPIIVSTSTGAVIAASKVSDQYACESVLSLDSRPDLSRQVTVETADGEAAVCLVSDVVPSTTHLIAISNGDRQFSAAADVRFETTQHAPLLVAVGEMGVGLSGPGKGATDGARRVDGLVSVFYQDSFTKQDLLSVAIRSKGSVNSANGNNGMFEFDPEQRIYSVMGDASTRQELGQSSSRVYARYDRGRSFVMYGDIHGDTPTEARSGLLEYNRNVTGLRFQLQTENPSNWLQGQAARPKTGYMRDIHSALAGSAIRLSRPQIQPGSESITLEIRDRRNPERILSRETLVRNVDYSLDPLSGTLFMMRSMSLFDPSLNLVQLVSTYEYETTGVNSAMYLGRGSYAVNRMGLRLGVSMLSQNEAGEDFSIGGLEFDQKLWNGGRLHAELPISHGKAQTGADPFHTENRNGRAIRAEFEQPLGVRDTVLRGRYAKTDEGFFNPYGAIAVQGQESGGASLETRGFESGRLSFGMEQEINRNSAVDNQRQTISAKLTQPLGENLSLETGIDRRQFRDHRSNQQIDSELISAGLKWKPLPRLETSIRREQNLGEADPTYPSQTLLGAKYRLTASSSIFATQRFSSAPITPIGGAEASGVLSPRSTRETAIGVESRLLKNTNLTTNYRMDASPTGADSFAVLGVLTRLPIRPGLSFDWALDHAVHLAGTGKGYLGGSFGFTASKNDKLRMSSRYEIRRGDTSQRILTAGIVGRLSASTSALARYRIANGATGTVGRLNDGQLALAVRPKKSDRVAMLFSYDFGNAPTNGLMVSPGRIDRLSADGLIQIRRGFEFYSKVAQARTPRLYGGSRLGTYLQGRLQKSLSNRFDIAGEARWIRESVNVRGALIMGAEWGTWLTRDLRVGLGYSSRGFANPGALLNSTSARGGPYLVMSSKLSSIFDLMGGSDKTN